MRERQAGSADWAFLTGGEGAEYYAFMKAKFLATAPPPQPVLAPPPAAPIMAPPPPGPPPGYPPGYPPPPDPYAQPPLGSLRTATSSGSAAGYPDPYGAVPPGYPPPAPPPAKLPAAELQRVRGSGVRPARLLWPAKPRTERLAWLPALRQWPDARRRGGRRAAARRARGLSPAARLRE